MVKILSDINAQNYGTIHGADKRKKISEICNVNGFKKVLKMHFLYSYTVEPDIVFY